jgi:hypothetical protein
LQKQEEDRKRAEELKKQLLLAEQTFGPEHPSVATADSMALRHASPTVTLDDEASQHNRRHGHRA